MPQISLYIDKETMDKLRKIAKSREQSISGWVRNHIQQTLMDTWSDDFLSLYGSVDDDSFTPIDRSYPQKDTPREEL